MTKHADQNRLQRRCLLATIATGATLALPGWALAKNALWMPEGLPLTPQQTAGPFYPEKTIEQQVFNDTDLSQKIVGREFAKGRRVIVAGVVLNRKGMPVQNSVVEVWQACASGRYNHPKDKKNASPLDNNFQFWGRSLTGEDGRYSFTTIIPGKYPGRTARHIHFRVDADGFKRCTTQCFFSDYGEDNMRDGIYRRLDAARRKLVTVEFDKPALTQNERKSFSTKNQESAETKSKIELPTSSEPWVGQFNIVLANQ